MIVRLALAGLAVAAALAIILIGERTMRLGAAAAPAAIPRVGFLSPASRAQDPSMLTLALRSVGLVNGKDIALDQRYAEGHDDRLDELARDLVRSKVRLILAMNPNAAVAAEKATDTIPIVFVSIANPISLGLVHSLARPGGNVTGIANMPLDLSMKRLEILKEALPDLRRVAIVARSGNSNSQFYAGRAAFAEQLGLEARTYDIDGPADYDAIFARIVEDGMQAILLVQDSVFYQTRRQLMTVATRHRLPIIGNSIEYAEDGAILSYGIPSYARIYDRAALYVDKILKGANPGELPVEQPMDLALAVNLRASKEMGITIPRALMLRANVIIE